MADLVSLYFWTILAGLAAAPALAILGAQLATRDRAMQSLCVGQGAMLGVLLGIGILHQFEGSTLGALGPFASAILLSALTVLATDRLATKRIASKNTIFAFVFALLLAGGSLVSSLFPALESHMAQVYFGDLATLTVLDSKITFFASIVCLALLLFWSGVFSNQSFELAMFGASISRRSGSRSAKGFQVITLVMLCLSVQFVGFLFTISMLFLPTALMNYLTTKGLRLHLSLCVLVSAVSTIVGFLFSLYYTRLPTVPAIVLVMFVMSLMLIGGDRLLQFVARSGSGIRVLTGDSFPARQG